MDSEGHLFEWKGYALAVVTFLFTFFFFYGYTSEFFWCLLAAVFTAGLAWGTYIVIRMIILTSRAS